MEVVCWNCKTKTTLDKAAVEAATKKMDETKTTFFDVPCANCGKINRTQRAEFDKAMTAMSAKAASATTAREATKQTKEENAKRRGEGKADKPKKGRK